MSGPARRREQAGCADGGQGAWLDRRTGFTGTTTVDTDRAADVEGAHCRTSSERERFAAGSQRASHRDVPAHRSIAKPHRQAEDPNLGRDGAVVGRGTTGGAQQFLLWNIDCPYPLTRVARSVYGKSYPCPAAGRVPTRERDAGCSGYNEWLYHSGRRRGTMCAGRTCLVGWFTYGGAQEAKAVGVVGSRSVFGCVWSRSRCPIWLIRTMMCYFYFPLARE
ncbi:hypothetical protein HYPSUDRAFT_1045635 [Hypholoma sublateritium FD-334 SS-4]|uniref:Uncharacterized protein n=1 Tax=Hypholoma sublateritium (strain FD-334 SS-4) TaxID=945553 RepID=A0A0D2M1D3_HYPSF|nr:hypothetical protein HYPSUDRAFT_1045635 [Hypholoma sublateritium FD-334 SS-4]